MMTIYDWTALAQKKINMGYISKDWKLPRRLKDIKITTVEIAMVFFLSFYHSRNWGFIFNPQNRNVRTFY